MLLNGVYWFDWRGDSTIANIIIIVQNSMDETCKHIRDERIAAIIFNQFD